MLKFIKRLTRKLEYQNALEEAKTDEAVGKDSGRVKEEAGEEKESY